MPELPEVENTRRYLVEAGLPGATFTGAQIGWDNTVRAPSSVDSFVAGITGQRVRQVERRGKYLLIPLGNAESSEGPDFDHSLGNDRRPARAGCRAAASSHGQAFVYS